MNTGWRESLREARMQLLRTTPVNASALEVVKGANYPSIAHLKGNVEIRANGFILRAEQADYDEQTGEIKASGKLPITPA